MLLNFAGNGDWSHIAGLAAALVFLRHAPVLLARSEHSADLYSLEWRPEGGLQAVFWKDEDAAASSGMSHHGI